MLNDAIVEQERTQIVESLLKQKLVGNNRRLAEEMAEQVVLLIAGVGDVLIEQGAMDSDVYMIFSGTADIVVNGRLVGQCHAGDHVGELASVGGNPFRTARVVMTKIGFVAKLSSEKLDRLAQGYPEIYRSIAQKLARLVGSLSQA